jgi:redox-sensitive bicupin YhaK (pirin superfamily)
VRVHQDVTLFASILEAGERVERAMDPMRHAWVQVARGSIAVNDTTAGQGDGVIVNGESSLQIVGNEASELLLFDLS